MEAPGLTTASASTRDRAILRLGVLVGLVAVRFMATALVASVESRLPGFNGKSVPWEHDRQFQSFIRHDPLAKCRA